MCYQKFTFADDTPLFTTGLEEVTSTRLLQKASNTVYEWTKKWKIKLNEAKSAHINFTNKRLNNLPAFVINGTVAPVSYTHLDVYKRQV